MTKQDTLPPLDAETLRLAKTAIDGSEMAAIVDDWAEAALKVCQAALAAQAPQPLTDAERVLSLLESGEWLLQKHQPSAHLTKKANARLAWSVRREAAPYCADDGARQWSGPTAMAAFESAMRALGIGASAGGAA